MTKTKKLIIIITSILLIVYLYWIYEVEIKHYFYKNNFIYWSENIEIKPSDFEGQINWDSEENESWNHSLYYMANNIKEVKVEAIFNKKKSWIKDTTNFKEIIKCQNLRFDLYEVYARKFNIKIDEIRNIKGKSLSDVDSIGKELFSELLIVEDSIFNPILPIDERVSLWEPKIKKWLKKYKSLKNNKIPEENNNAIVKYKEPKSVPYIIDSSWASIVFKNTPLTYPNENNDSIGKVVIYELPPKTIINDKKLRAFTKHGYFYSETYVVLMSKNEQEIYDLKFIGNDKEKSDCQIKQKVEPIEDGLLINYYLLCYDDYKRVDKIYSSKITSNLNSLFVERDTIIKTKILK